jgi:hypothetical protein
MMAPKGYKMTTDPNAQMSYNQLFPQGQEPPIMDKRKRNRRLSSIVGIRSTTNPGEFEMDKVLEGNGADAVSCSLNHYFRK